MLKGEPAYKDIIILVANFFNALLTSSQKRWDREFWWMKGPLQDKQTSNDED